MTADSPLPGNRTERGKSTHAVPTSPVSFPRSAVLPAGAVAAACVAAAAVVLFGHPSPGMLRAALAGVTGGAVLMLVVALVAARAARRQIAAQIRESRLAVRRSQAELQQLTDRVMRGERPAPLPQSPAGTADGPFRQLAGDLEQSRQLAAQAVLRVADRMPAERPDQQVEIFVNLARRMQSLVHREIELLDDLEASVEDPELLKGLFTVDHLATRLRRQYESLAVLGGSSSRRQWTRQVTMHEVLRAAIAEVEQYSRVKVVPPVEGVLRGAAVTDVIHLIAELVENATKFSAPTTTALLRAQQVAAGVAIEVEDRGLGMIPVDQQRMNELLANPGRMDIDELLRDGRIGLYVVAALARRHGIRVQLQNNIYGGTQAVVVLPKTVLDVTERGVGPAPAAVAAADRSSPASQRLALVSADAGAGWGAGIADPEPGPLPPAEGAQPSLPSRRLQSGASNSALPWAVLDGPDSVARPPLPKRQAQASAVGHPDDYVPDEPGGAPAASGGEPLAGQLTGLMADFLRGVSRAKEE
jgi:signal transduction histidine kinase